MYGIPVLGVIENMAYMDVNGKRIHPFGKPIGETIARDYSVEYLGMLPLDPRIPELLENGNPRIPDDIRQPIELAVERIISSKPRGLATRLKKLVRDKARDAIVKAIAQGLVLVNSRMNIRELRLRYGLPGGRILTLIITEDEGKPIVSFNFTLKDDRLVVVKGKARPDVIIEVPVKTAVDIIRGRRKVAGREVEFDVKAAWALGELKVYGMGVTPLLLYVIEKILADREVTEFARKTLSPIMKLLG